MLYPAAEGDPLRQTWAVRLASEKLGLDPGPDRVFVQTKNMGVRVYAGLEDEGGERCCVQ